MASCGYPCSNHGCIPVLQVVMLRTVSSPGPGAMGAWGRWKQRFLISMLSWRRTPAMCKLWAAEGSSTSLWGSRRYCPCGALLIFLRVLDNVSVNYHRTCFGISEIRGFSQNLGSERLWVWLGVWTAHLKLLIFFPKPRDRKTKPWPLFSMIPKEFKILCKHSFKPELWFKPDL